MLIIGFGIVRGINVQGALLGMLIVRLESLAME